MGEIWSVAMAISLAALAGLVGFLVATNSRLRGRARLRTVEEEADGLRAALSLKESVLPELDGVLPGMLRPGDLLSVFNPLNADEVMILGDERQAEQFGKILGPVPRQLSALAVGARAFSDAGLTASEQAGVLVRLSPESARLFRQLRTTVDEGGAFLGVLRGSSGRFEHVIRFKSAMGIQALTGVTGVLSAVAMQAQLAAIEKSIASVSEDIRRVQLTLDIQAASRIRGVSEALKDLYESASATGIMTEATWNQVAPLGAQAFTNRDYADRRLRALVEDLGDRKSTADRRSWFKKYQPELIDAMLELDEAERSVIQFTILRLWWLNVTNDPALTYYAEDLSSRLLDRSERRDAVKLAVASTIHDAAKSAWFHWVLSPFDTRSNERAVERLLSSLIESGLLSTRDVQVLTAESPPNQLESLHRPAGADGLS